jgi:hypothetical protein
MTLFDPGVEVLLESARGAREPTALDRARNRAALEARLGPLGPSAAPLPAVSPAVSPSAGAGGAAPVTLSAALKWKLASLGALTATLGFLVGLGVGRQVSEGAQPSPLSAPPTVVAAPLAVSEVAALEPREAAAVAAPPSAAAEPEISNVAASPRQRARVATAPRPPAPRTDSNFLQALRLLERAQRALDAGEAAFAMSLLNDLDAGFPRSLLAEERQVARVLGWCALGDTERARVSAQSLLGSNVRSIYAGRLERSCIR